jgi:stage V sporulation protein B
VEYRIQQAMRLSLVTGGLSVVVLYVFAEPLMQWMYGTSEATMFVKVMAPFFLFYYFQGPLQAVLQGLDLANAAMINSLIGAVVKLACIFALATQPSLGIMGAALAIAINTVLVTLLHFATVVKAVSCSIYAMEYMKAFLSMVAAGIVGYVSFHYSFAYLPLSLQTLASIIVTIIIYSLLLIIFQLIRREELAYIPGIGAFITKKKRK